MPDTRRRVLGPWCQGPCLGDPPLCLWGSCPPSRSSRPCSVRFAEPFPRGQQGCVSDVPSAGADTHLWSLCLFLKVFALESCSPSLCADRNLSHSSGAGQTRARAPLSPFQRWSGRAQRGGRCCRGSQGPAQLQGCWGPSSALWKQGLFQREDAVEINPNLQSVRPTFSPPPSDRGEIKPKSRFWINRIFLFKWFHLCVCCADDFSCRVRSWSGKGHIKCCGLLLSQARVP